ncbi:antiviral reverse transcriptase Drt3a [Pantoea agglomerans]|uniref:antiviral reverse transcriptase Drt3a n=1 Tax=Enterobacter agglomerans TaxID=549 RepID=UPI0016546994|nr:antiviral reverse transcriptase Drt3a [Pantoea agglomerans]MBD8145294.1 RNA-directed DNA polymerase [Pantoea agglomerans]WVL80247.1 antiviral reverse transcriptase Drt3a [Pantoea agglomerans]
MEQLSYTHSNLYDCITYTDLMEDKTLIDYSNRIAASLSAQSKAAAKLFLDNGIKEISIAGKKGVKYSNIEDKLISKLLVRNIKKGYRIRKVNRHEIIKNLITHLKDGSPYNITRLDIRSFYESIDFNFLLEKITSEGRISRYNLNLLYKYKESLSSKNIQGLPRGVSLSATLAELCLQDIDSYFLKRKDVFFYSRFVDDILILHHGDKITKQIIIDYFFEKLPKNLKLHDKDKLAFLNVSRARDCSEKIQLQSEQPFKMDFLGYEFKIYNVYDNNDFTFSNNNRKVQVDLSSTKIVKIKKRIIKSFLSYIGSNQSQTDFDLLNDRIKFITGNYPIKDPSSGIKINSGIFYNYQHKNSSLNCALENLDNFLRSILFSKKNKLYKRLSTCISIKQKRELCKLNFKNGFYLVRFHTFNYARLKQIKECWK